MKHLIKFKLVLIVLFGVSVFTACSSDDPVEPVPCEDCPTDNTPTPYSLKLPPLFATATTPLNIPADNPLTVEGIALGKRLFYEKKLSVNNSISCSSCHKPENSFSDKGVAFSLGAVGQPGIINAMPLFNLIYADSYNWDGSAASLEKQALIPVAHPLEMMESWKNVALKLQGDPSYVNDFSRAFPKEPIDSITVAKALAQFERTLISGNTRADNEFGMLYGIPPSGPTLTLEEKRGFEVFDDQERGDCGHCHGGKFNPNWTEFTFQNNGLDLNPDSGLAKVTKQPFDVGKFKVPSLRNLIYTAPYMHDGRFNTIEEVVEFYMSGVNRNSPNLSPDMVHRSGANGHKINLTPQEKSDLVAFLKALSDDEFVNNPNFRP
tara:strand:+ start:1346 stop:2479 length:1134 start_codon:yes stop_codon:yes gene_type:complete